jgi:hypothetical protein
MRVAVIGSWRRVDRATWQLHDEAGFRTTAEALGHRLIELGHSLIVGSDGPDTADYLAARGAAAAAGPDLSRRVHILAPRAQNTQWFSELRREYPRLFTEQSIAADDWAPAKIFQVRHADAVVIMAGAQMSRQAGLTAAASGKRLVCIGSFGGAARMLNELFMQSRESWGGNLSDADTLGVLQNPWNDVLLEDVLKDLRALKKPRILIIHGRAEDRSGLKAYLGETLGLPDPIVLADVKTPSRLIPAKFEELASQVDAAIALCTPDDVGQLAESVAAGATPDQRARQNVWLEVGWFWGRLGLERVLILTRGAVDVPSDLKGVEAYEYATSPRERETEIGAFLAKVGSGRDD